MPTSAKFRENLNLQQFKVIQGRLVPMVSTLSEFLLVINSNFVNAHAFLSNFSWVLFRWTLWRYGPKLQSVALHIPEIIAIAVLSWGCEPPILGKGRPYGVGGRDGTVRKSVGDFL